MVCVLEASIILALQPGLCNTSFRVSYLARPPGAMGPSYANTSFSGSHIVPSESR